MLINQISLITAFWRIEIRLSRHEQEVVITLNAEEDTAQVYTAYPVWIRKMDRLCRQHPEIFKMVDEVKGISKTYECPKRYVSVRKPKISRIQPDFAK